MNEGNDAEIDAVALRDSIHSTVNLFENYIVVVGSKLNVISVNAIINN